MLKHMLGDPGRRMAAPIGRWATWGSSQPLCLLRLHLKPLQKPIALCVSLLGLLAGCCCTAGPCVGHLVSQPQVRRSSLAAPGCLRCCRECSRAPSLLWECSRAPPLLQGMQPCTCNGTVHHPAPGSGSSPCLAHRPPGIACPPLRRPLVPLTFRLHTASAAHIAHARACTQVPGQPAAVQAVSRGHPHHCGGSPTASGQRAPTQRRGVY